MKTFSALVLSAATVLLAPSHVLAAECSEADLNVYTKLGRDTAAMDACEAVLKAKGAATIDTAVLATLNPCDDKPCLAYFEKFASELSDCTVQGFPLRQPFDALLAVCKQTPGGPMPTPVTNTPVTTKPGAGTTPANSSTTTAPVANANANANVTAAPKTPAPTTSGAAHLQAAVTMAVLIASTLAGLVAL